MTEGMEGGSGKNEENKKVRRWKKIEGEKVGR